MRQGSEALTGQSGPSSHATRVIPLTVVAAFSLVPLPHRRARVYHLIICPRFVHEECP